ncbi:MAG: rRNA pseudouridine synthase [Candidatus Omnitrophica bacterium]|nr:rRNA pseudouridine synthase [Candidatus Omnitrophota bacterium]
MAERLRLQVALAKLGIASRRGAKQIIEAGRVKINGRTVLKPAERLNIEKDIVTVDGQRRYIQKNVYFILNKPKGVVSTVKDKYAKRSVLDLVKQKGMRIYPVGRLDQDTTGLLLLTNDGELTQRLTHPRFGIKKVYRVCVRGEIELSELKKLEQSIFLEGKRTYPCKIKLLTQDNKTTSLEIQLSEGRKRQIKKMFALVGHPVLSITRVAFGPLRLTGLKAGEFRRLKEEELIQLKKATGLR